jgi:class 3 adenylate cyclase/tetratricopeptide (TPR) repeat protein
MKCKRCGFQNPEGFSFCGQCGARLGTSNEPLSKADLDHLRAYLPLALIESLQFDLMSPSPHLLEQCITPLTSLLETICTLLPAYLVDRVVANPIQGQTDGLFTDGTLLFADISGFTVMSEQFSHLGQEGAEELITIVNNYFGAMLAILREHDGQLVEFGGDALLGLFVGPHSANRAVQTAQRMQEAMSSFAKTQTSLGAFPLQIKVGVHKGQFFAAQLGTTQRMIHALLGADVNATAALEDAAMPGQILVDRATLEAVDIPCQATQYPYEERYWIVEQIAPIQAVARTPVPALWSLGTSDATLDGLRQVVGLLDALAPYLPAGLLPRLVGSAHITGLEGEHRLVSVLFANIHGLGDLADRLGLGHEKEVALAVNRYFSAMADAIHHYGGVINKMDLSVRGDKLLAFFGAPMAHEDDAERAVRAALDMQEKIGEIGCELPAEFGLTDLCLEQAIGISYGYVFAGYVGTGWRHEYTVMGDEVNLAEHLLSVSSPGEVIISEHIARRAQIFCELTPHNDVVLKGQLEPISTFSVSGLRAMPETLRGLKGIHSPMVGRENEWHQLLTAMDRLLSGQGQIVSVIGETGLGKSRLVAEMRKHVGTLTVRWIEGRCLSYTESVSYWPFQEILRQMTGLRPDDRGMTGWRKLRSALEGTSALSDLSAVLPYLATFLDLPVETVLQERIRYLDAEALQRRTFIAISILLEASARGETAPLILVLEDIHWIDQASSALLEHLMPLVDRIPLMLLLVYRPERGKRCWQIREKITDEYAYCASEITLRPLKPPASQQLLSNLVPLERWPTRMRDLILSRTEGNPLYLEEVLRVLIDNRALFQDANGNWQIGGTLEDMQVPDTLQGVIMAHLDRLRNSSRWTAQIAAVIGRVFAFDILEYVLQMSQAQLSHDLALLQEQEIVRESARTPQLVYVFNHAMMQDVCYRSLLAHTRRVYHRRIAEYLSSEEMTGRGETESSYPFVAYHAFVGQDWPRAIHYQLLSGQRAQKLFANEAAIDHYHKVLQSAEHLPPDQVAEQQLKAETALGELLTTTGQYDEALEHLKQARSLAIRQGNQEIEAQACRWLARLHELRSEYSTAAEWIQEGLVALEGRETVEMTQLLIDAGLINTRLGNYDSALNQCEISLHVAEKLGEVAVLARSYTLLGHLNRLRGANAMAVWYFQRGLDLYEIAGDINGQAIAHDLIATAEFHMGQWQEAERHYLRAREIFALIGNKYSLALADNNLGGIALNQGRLDEALGFYQRALRSLEQMGESLYVQGALHMNLGHTFVRRGEPEAAYEHLRAAESQFEQAQARDWLPEMYRHFAEAALISSDLDGAHAHAQKALQLARELSMRNEEGNSLRILGRIACAQGQHSAAERHLTESVGILLEIHDDYEWARSLLALAQLRFAQGQVARSTDALERCAPVLARLGARQEMADVQALQGQIVELTAPETDAGEP